MHHHQNVHYRSLELICRQQAALSLTPETRKELERMALEYRRIADWLDQRRAEAARVAEGKVG